MSHWKSVKSKAFNMFTSVVIKVIDNQLNDDDDDENNRYIHTYCFNIFSRIYFNYY